MMPRDEATATNRQETYMARLPLMDPASAPDAVGKVLAGTPLNLFRIVAHAESAFEPWLKYGAALLTRLELDPLLRELAILQVAHLVESPYEWVQHVPIALSLGASDEQIAAVEHDSEDDPSLTGVQREVLRFARAVVLDGTASEQLVADITASLNERQVVELLLVLGHYMAIARLIATTGLQPDPPLASLTARAERQS
jgi:4-carboxymuconolactone decarboxylase